MLVKIKGTEEVIFRSTPSQCKDAYPDKVEKTFNTYDDNGVLLKPATSPRPVEFVYEKTRFEQQALLNDTDWYLTRKIETGESIPDDIQQSRAEARAFLSSS
ncbi:hypothetical protein [Pseudoalteromonas luteoviolacea]|uniref:Uncharacterized protein n=1 Tax=Pseudoalteromonas luteoviolacea NCIMB 1942 TaxID=1365253 RepID=A0A166Z8C0_9GAMM|nr:hypothetical protein [Pseudoalteromonas luteoviolacea]KZN44042.1 hypothetical protein N482_18085 [Pseudoalteromonas luteoviolacea NCIMB 1942]